MAVLKGAWWQWKQFPRAEGGSMRSQEIPCGVWYDFEFWLISYRTPAVKYKEPGPFMSLLHKDDQYEIARHKKC
jgi:hypothetical protein